MGLNCVFGERERWRKGREGRRDVEKEEKEGGKEREGGKGGNFYFNLG